MLAKLQEIVNTSHPRVLGARVKSKANRSLYDWLLVESSELLHDATIVERIHYVLQGKPNISCSNGKQMKFSATRQEYGFCDNIKNCECFRKKISDERKGNDCNGMVEKRVSTWLQKYGVDNVSKCPEIVAKSAKTKSERNYTKLWEDVGHRKETVGYQQVIDRVSTHVTPMFSRDEYSGSSRMNKYSWKCVTCAHEFFDHIDYGRVPVCKVCYPHNQSIGELELANWIGSLGINTVRNSKTIIPSGLEIDIFLPDYKVAIEYNGVYWHSTKHKNKSYHVDKMIECRDAGIHLIQIFEDEWKSKCDIVKSRILSLVGKNKRFHARKCTICEISPSEYVSFVTDVHLQGYGSASVIYGLRDVDRTLVALMSFGRPRYDTGNKESTYELIRYCSRGNVVGGASRLFSHFVKSKQPKTVISYASRNWSQGKIYENLGFKNVTKNDRNVALWYIKDNVRYHRSTLNKKRLVKLGYDASKTAEAILDELGYLTICDSGNYKFLWSAARD